MYLRAGISGSLPPQTRTLPQVHAFSILWFQSKDHGTWRERRRGHSLEVKPQSERKKGRKTDEQMTNRVGLVGSTDARPRPEETQHCLPPVVSM